MKLNLNYDTVKNDGQYHTMWKNGLVEICGYVGEFGNISLNVFVSGIPYLATYSYRDVCEFVENHFNQP